jgi:hypothetical protein
MNSNVVAYVSIFMELSDYDENTVLFQWYGTTGAG